MAVWCMWKGGMMFAVGYDAIATSLWWENSHLECVFVCGKTYCFKVEDNGALVCLICS